MDYHMATSVADALDTLLSKGCNAKIIAGGTDILLDLQSGRKQADALVDISRIEELKRIVLEGDELVIGGAVTHDEIVRSELVKKYAPALAQGCVTVGSLQIRNVATLAGNVINAQPAADGAVALSVYEPRFIIKTPSKTREDDLPTMYTGFGKSGLDCSQEILTEIRIPVQKENQYSAFSRVELRKALALPMLNCAVLCQVNRRSFEWIRISMAPVGVGPVRAAAAEAWLKGKSIDDANIQKGADLALQDANPRSNVLRGSAKYRKDVLPVLVSDCIHKALEAGGL
ncbi:FAD binding domain-containing protein [Ruminococcaceae bacterium OttesenSCG-928-I18]|nr:FAD binding domain-containing protein [Ruminococcaceae bacterium OttesenSCG-928-I18]